MKKIKLIVLITLLFVGGCQKEAVNVSSGKMQSLSSTEITSLYETEKKNYDKFLKKFAKSFAKSLKEKEMRKLLKKEALYKIDGDYDIIWKNLKFLKVKTKKGEKYINEFISEEMEGDDKEKKLKQIDDFSDKYKKLQVSVPVHCEDWDDEVYEPYVAFLPADYDECWEEIEAFNSEGEIVKLSNKEIPQNPVIVIGLNERSDENGDISSQYRNLKIIPIGGCDPLSAPYNLSATTAGNSINLSWSQSLPSDLSCIMGYEIYRKGEGESTFSLVGTNNGYQDRAYYDTDFLPSDANRSFSYYVIAFGLEGNSQPSGIASALAPNPPNPVVSFSATNYALRTVFLKWENDINDYHSETRLYRTIVSPQARFTIYKTFTDNTSDLFEYNLTPGLKYHYKIVHVNGIDISNPKYDFVQVPYRDINQASPVYVTNISFTNWDLENWPAGKPEFRIWIGNSNKVSGLNSFFTGSYDDGGRRFDFSSVTSSQNFNENALFSWHPSYWEDLVAIRVVEHDDNIWNGKITAKLGVGVNKKISETAQITAELGGELNFKFEDMSEDCGTAFYNYYDNTSFELSSGFGYGLKLQLNNSN